MWFIASTLHSHACNFPRGEEFGHDDTLTVWDAI